LEHTKPKTSEYTNKQKDIVMALLNSCTARHYTITSASANYTMAIHIEGTQRGEMTLLLMGGMSEVQRFSISSGTSFERFH
jgi:hypothetical protein